MTEAGADLRSSGAAFRESDIRPNELMAEQSRLYEADVRRLMRRRDEFVDVACPACDEPEGNQPLAKYGLTFVECLNCATVYVSPRPTPEILDEYYASSENYVFWSKFIFPASESIRRQEIFGPRADKALRTFHDFGIEPGLVVDIGAGFGTFLDEMRQRGSFRRLVAIEPTPDLAESCRARGLEVLECSIEEASLDGQAELVTAFEVLEHLYDPPRFFQIAMNILRPGGLLMVTCPNIQGFDLQLLKERSATVDAEHLNYFNPKSIEMLATRFGFEVLEVATPGVLDAEIARRAVLAGDVDLTNQPFLHTVLIDEWDRLGGRFQEFLSDNRLSSHMSLTCRSPGSVR